MCYGKRLLHLPLSYSPNRFFILAGGDLPATNGPLVMSITTVGQYVDHWLRDAKRCAARSLKLLAS